MGRIVGSLILTLFAVQTASSRSPKAAIVFESECSCRGNHGVSRWAAKTDWTDPPTNNIQVHSITPSEIFEWHAPGGNIPRGAGRMAAEKEWYAVTGRIKKVRAEDDGDLHIVLADASGDKPGEVVVEIPLGERWCVLRKLVFTWTDAVFPFSTGRSPFRLVGDHVITAVGQAFYDVDHSGKDTRSNRRSDKKLAVWEIHPVMRIDALGALHTAAPSATPKLASTMTGTSALAKPTATPDQFVTITQPVPINIVYGKTVIPRGMKLPVVSREGAMVRVRYMNDTYTIPVSSTDLH